MLRVNYADEWLVMANIRHLFLFIVNIFFSIPYRPCAELIYKFIDLLGAVYILKIRFHHKSPSSIYLMGLSKTVWRGVSDAP